MAGLLPYGSPPIRRGTYARAVEVDDFMPVSPTPAQTLTAINTAISTAGSSHPVRFTPGRTYSTTAAFSVGTDAHIIAHGAIIKNVSGSGDNLIKNVDTIGGNANITIEGGIWDYNLAVNASASTESKLHGLFFRNCDNLTLKQLKVINVLKWAILVADSDDVHIVDIVFDTASDGLHCHGPMSRPLIQNLRGVTGDDFLVFTTDDYPGYATSVGNFDNIEVDGLYPSGSVTACAFAGDPAHSFNGNNTVRNVKGSVTTAAIRVVNDPVVLTQTNGDSFTFQNIAVDNGNTAAPIINISADTINSILIEGLVHTDTQLAIDVGTTSNLGTLTIKSMRSTASAVQALVLIEGTVGDLIFDGITATLGTGGKVFQVAGSVARAVLSGVFTTGGTALFTHNAGTPALKVYENNLDCTGLTDGHILGAYATIHLSNARIGAVYTFWLNNAAAVVRVLAGVVAQDTMFRPVAFTAGSVISANGEMLIMDTSGADAINAPVAGDRVTNRISGKPEYYNGTAWVLAADVFGPSSSIDSEIALFNSTTGKLIKRASTTGILKGTSGVLSAATPGTDYYNPGGTDVAVADGGTGASTATGAFNALDPLTTKGDIITNNGTDSIRLAIGTDTHVLTADSSVAAGVKWAAGGGGGSPGGLDTQVQFNDSGSFGGDAGLTFTKATGQLSVSGPLQADPTTGDGGVWSNATPLTSTVANRLSSPSDSLPALALRAGKSLPITNKQLTSNVVTITTSVAHNYAIGRSVIIEGLGSPFDGTYTLASKPTTTTFTYAKTAANVASTPVAMGTGYAGNMPFFATNDPVALRIEDGAGVEQMRVVGDDGRLLWATSGVSGGVKWGPTPYASTGVFITDAGINPGFLLLGSGVTQASITTSLIGFNAGLDTMSIFFTTPHQFYFNIGIRTPSLNIGNPVSGTPLATTDITSVLATDKVLILRGAASQSADLQQWQDNGLTVLSRIDSLGNLGIGVSPTALIHLKAGTATANTAPLKLTSGTKLTTAEAGVHEYNGNHLLTNSVLRFPVGGVLFDHYADVGNVGTGEDDLYSDTLTASTLSNNGDKVTATYQGIFSGAVASTQDLRLYFGGTKIYDSGALAIGVATDSWTATVTVIRESSSVVRCSVAISTDFATLFPYSAYTRITGLTLTNTQVLKLTGEAAGAGAVSDQVVAKLGYIEYKPGV